MCDAVEGGVAWVEAVFGILEDDLDFFADGGAVEVAGRDVADRGAIEKNIAFGRVDQAADHA